LAFIALGFIGQAGGLDGHGQRVASIFMREFARVVAVINPPNLIAQPRRATVRRSDAFCGCSILGDSICWKNIERL